MLHVAIARHMNPLIAQPRTPSASATARGSLHGPGTPEHPINDVHPTGPVLAHFRFEIRAAKGATRIAEIDGRQLGDIHTVRGGFGDAVSAAHGLAAEVRDGLHPRPTNQAHALRQAADGAWQIIPLGGFDRGANAPLFVDGDFFRRAGRRVDVTRIEPDIAAIVGLTSVLDLRAAGIASRVEARE